MDSLTVDVVIGLVFVFAAFAGLVTILTELVARYLGLRGEYLLRGIRSLLDGKCKFELTDFGLRNIPGLGAKEAPPPPAPATPWVTRLMSHPLVRPSADKGNMPEEAGNAKLPRKERRKLPAYLSSAVFSQALMDLLVPDAKGATTIKQIRDEVEKLPDNGVRKQLLSLLRAADDQIDKFRLSVEQWYDNQMSRVSGWYKRHVRWISLAIGAALVLLFNVNAVTIAQALYSDEALREGIVTQAMAASDCGEKPPAECLASAREQIASARGAGLPLGWGVVPDCLPADQASACTAPEKYGLADPDSNGASDLRFLGVLLVGYTAMLIALLPGARFWFDLLSRLGSLRSTGPKPDRPQPAAVITIATQAERSAPS